MSTMNELERLAREGDSERRKNIARARLAWQAIRRERTDEGAILTLLSLIEHVQFGERSDRAGGAP